MATENEATMNRPDFVPEKDCWYGVDDPKERKKIQDRLAQRARRRRLASAAQEQGAGVTKRPRRRATAKKKDGCDGDDDDDLETRVRQLELMIDDIKTARRYYLLTNQFLQPYEVDYQKYRRLLIGPSSPEPGYGVNNGSNGSNGDADDEEEEEEEEEGSARRLPTKKTIEDPFSGILDAIRAQAAFPHPAEDPFFLSIPAITVYAALWYNGLPMNLRCQPTMTRHLTDRRYARARSRVPPDLRPTHSQMTIPHMTWIDRFPFPHFRDNMIRYTEEGFGPAAAVTGGEGRGGGGGDSTVAIPLIDAEDFMRDLFEMRSFSLVPGGSAWVSSDWRLGTEFGAKWGFIFL